MAYEAHSFQAALNAAAGDDAALHRELARGFVESAELHFDLLGRARCDANWSIAARKLRTLAASFHAGELMEMAAQAENGAPGDPRVLRAIGDCLAGLRAEATA